MWEILFDTQHESAEGTKQDILNSIATTSIFV